MAGMRRMRLPATTLSGSSPLKTAATNYLDPSKVDPNTPEAMMALATKNRQALSEGGFSTEVAPQEAPEVPDMGVYAESQGRESLARALRGLTGTVPVTAYGAKLGHHAGMPMNSPTDQGNAAWAESPWKAEQQRVANANTLHAFNNQYSQMKSLAKNTDTQKALDMAKDQSVAAAYAGFMGQNLDIQRENLKRGNLALENTLRHQGIMEDLARKAGTRAENKAEATVGVPTGSERNEYIHATGAKVALTNLKHIIETDPTARDLVKGAHLTWGELRKTTSPQAQAIMQQRDLALDHIGQMQRRLLMRGGSGAVTLQSALGKFGDDQQVDLQALEQFMGQADMQRKFIREQKQNFPWDTIDEDFISKIAPAGSPGLGGPKPKPSGFNPDEYLK